MIQFNTIPEALEDLRQGKLILVTDDPERENEGDFICAAEFATTENVNFMATHGKGLDLCMPMSEYYVKSWVCPRWFSRTRTNWRRPFTVSIDHVHHHRHLRRRALHHCHGLRAGERQAGGFPPTGACSRCWPRKNGVLERNGHTEATVDPVPTGGAARVGLCCEIMREDGTMMRTPELAELAKRYNIKFVTIRDLQNYRKSHESW